MLAQKGSSLGWQVAPDSPLPAALALYLKRAPEILAHVAAGSVRQSSEDACKDYPHLLIGSAAIAIDETDDQVLTLTVVTKHGGVEQARQLVQVLRDALYGVQLDLGAAGTAALRVTFSDIFRAVDWRLTYGVLRVKAAAGPAQALAA